MPGISKVALCELTRGDVLSDGRIVVTEPHTHPEGNAAYMEYLLHDGTQSTGYMYDAVELSRPRMVASWERSSVHDIEPGMRIQRVPGYAGTGETVFVHDVMPMENKRFAVMYFDEHGRTNCFHRHGCDRVMIATLL